MHEGGGRLHWRRSFAPWSDRPDFVEHARRHRRLVLGQKTPVVLRYGVGRVLDRVAGLLVGPRLLEDVGGQDIADIMRAVR